RGREPRARSDLPPRERRHARALERRVEQPRLARHIVELLEELLVGALQVVHAAHAVRVAQLELGAAARQARAAEQARARAGELEEAAARERQEGVRQAAQVDAELTPELGPVALGVDRL